MSGMTIYGGPGTGKTHYFLKTVEEQLHQGVESNKIAYLAFTRRAASEAKARAKLAQNLIDEEIPHFRTIHSFARRNHGVSTNRILNAGHLQEFAERLGLELSRRSNRSIYDDTLGWRATEDDKLFFMIHMLRVDRMSFDEAASGVSLSVLDMMSDDGWFQDEDRLRFIWQGYDRFKRERGLVDFTDILELFLKEGVTPKLDLIILDESQDLTKLQWAVINKIKAERPEAEYIQAGDFHQSIYDWAGANYRCFIDAAYKTDKIYELPQSFRVPTEIRSVAQTIATKIRYDHPTEELKWLPAPHKGHVEYIDDLCQIPEEHKGDLLILSRTFNGLRKHVKWLQEEGLDFAVLREKPSAIKLSTIHGSKGSQAKSVVVDLSVPQIIEENMDESTKLSPHHDSEIKVWYTAVTRASQNLYFFQPTGRWSAEKIIC